MKKALLILTLFVYGINNAQIVNILDVNFKNALLSHNPVIDVNDDGEIQVSEALNTERINVSDKNISDLTGIADFTNLTSLYCYDNPLSTLDISNNTNLISLICFNNQLNTLNISNNTNLNSLTCAYNQLSVLDINSNTNLTYLHCGNNQLNYLNTDNNTILSTLYCNDNPLNTLDISDNTNLTKLYCNDNQLNTLDISNNTNLTQLRCNDNQLNTLDVSNNTNLTQLRCNDNQLNTLDVSNNTNLTSLYCNNNQLTNIYLPQINNLENLYCSSNRLTSLDLRNVLNPNFTFNTSNFHFQNNPNLYCVSVDDYVYSSQTWTNLDEHTVFRENCSLGYISDFHLCDDNNEIFNLSTKDNEIINGQTNVVVSYYNTLNDAQNNTNQLPATNYTNTSNPQQIFSRLENTTNGTFEINSFFLKVDNIYYYKATSYITCDFDGNGFEEFDLSVKRNLIKKNFNINVAFFTNITDANNNTNPLTDLYTNTSNFQTIYYRVENDFSSCFKMNHFILEVRNCPVQTYVPDDYFEQELINLGYDNTLDNNVLTENIMGVTRLLLSNYRYISDLTGIASFVSLENLNCSTNQLSNLDVTQNTNLKILHCYGNQLTSLDVSQNPSLRSLKCNQNQLTSLDISQNTSLRSLKCNQNQLTSLDISQNTSLSHLECNQNQLTSLDVTQNTNLEGLYCYGNQLTSLNVSQNTNLKNLYCHSNQLTSLDASQNRNLKNLYCHSNQLTSLDASQNRNLKNLYCHSNQLNSLDVTQNTNLTHIVCSLNQITSLDVTQNSNLIILNCDYNQITSIDVTQNSNLTQLKCDYNLLGSLDVSQNLSLSNLTCNYNQLVNLNFSQNTNLTNLSCGNNQLTSLDVSLNSNLRQLNVSHSSNLTYINLKNGNNNNFDVTGAGYWFSDFQNTPNLQTVCVDELNTALTTFIVTETGHAVTFTEYCNFASTQSNTINGTVNIDIDNNGCDTNDISLNNVLITADNGTESFGTFVLENATYSMFTNEGDFTTAVTTNLPNYWSVTPSTQTNTFTGFNNTFTADFCLIANQTINDVNISIIPTTQAKPGFDVTYQIVYTNVGTTQLNGTVTLNFDGSKLSFLSTNETVDTQTANSLAFNYTTLNSFETRTIDLVFNVNAPTATLPTNIGDILNFTVTINPITGDYTTNDNIFTLDQTVIGSYDPNDITCLEGNEILLENVDKYLHYVIRFQNSGTASAINIVVKNILDAKLDWSTIQLETTSHNSRVVIKNGNEIEFIFENINLPDENTDESGSHGFITYKIKPKNNVVLGDIFNNTANIFFDFNEAITTNTATTTITNNVLSTTQNSILNFSIYPIPTKDILNINSKTAINSIKIYSKLGQLISENTKQNTINISNLSQGLYFVKVKDINDAFGIKKVIVK